MLARRLTRLAAGTESDMEKKIFANRFHNSTQPTTHLSPISSASMELFGSCSTPDAGGP